MTTENTETKAVAVRDDGGKMHARDITIGANGINFKNAAEVMAFARMMAESGFAVRKPFRDNPGACLAVIDDAVRFGMSPYFLARKAYLVNDQLAYESAVFAAVIIERAPLAKLPKYEFTGEGKDRVCKVTLYLKPGFVDGDVIVHESPKFGAIQPKNSPLWTNDPDQQQSYYTIRAAARRHFPHVLGGAYDMEEAAAARAIDVTPRASIIDRLPGSQNGDGFNSEAISREMERELPAAEVVEPEEAESEENDNLDDGMTPEERATIEEIRSALDEAKTQKEIDVIASDFAAMLTSLGAVASEVAQSNFADRRAKLAKKSKKKGGDEEGTLV